MKVVDSTGAGDSFFSAVLSELTDSKQAEDALKLGMKVAAQVIASTENGLIPEMLETIR